MQPAWILNRCIWGLNLIASALVIWRLYHFELNKVYRYFLLSLALGVMRSVALFPFSTNGVAYYRIWAFTQPLVWLSFVLVVGELYVLVLREYRGIYSLGRWFFFAAVTLSVLISGLTVLPALETTATATGKWLLISCYLFVERGVVTSLAIFLVLLLLLVVWFPVPLSRNLLIHCSVYSAYFIAQNVVALYWQTGTQGSAALASSLLRLSVGIACYSCWVVFLTRQGEDRLASLRQGRNPEREKRLLGQLEDLNATLLGARK